jgi:hypothetical protein
MKEQEEARASDDGSDEAGEKPTATDAIASSA